jgi:methionine-rich copper-binding protein CopC
VKRAALAAFVVTALLSVVGAPAARAHAELLTSTPADGTSLTAPPAEVDLTFSEDLLPETVSVSVVPEGASPAALGTVAVDGSTVTVPWPSTITSGAVAVNFRVVSQDGHPVTGSVRFTIEPAADAATSGSESSAPAASAASTAPVDTASSASSGPTPEPTSEPTSGSSIPPLAMVSLGLAIGIAVGFVLYLRRRRSP